MIVPLSSRVSASPFIVAILLAQMTGLISLIKMACLNRLLEENGSPCRAYIMSDRPKTVELLGINVLQRNCSVITADHDSGEGPVNEHGPWAGAGFLEDLDEASRARHGIIGDPHRSSTALLIDLIEHRRRIVAWEKGGKADYKAEAIDDLHVCKLPRKSPSGYNYGPGTPTFRHHSYLEPLAPIRIVESFVQANTDRKDKGIVASMNLDLPTVEQIYTVLNSFIYAMLSSRVLLVDSVAETFECTGGLGFEQWVRKSSNWLGKVSHLEFRASRSDVNWTKGGSDASLFELSFDNFHYTEPDWIRLSNSGDENHLERNDSGVRIDTEMAEALYAHESDFLYGLLFNEISSFCPYPPSSDDPPSETTPSIVLHLSNETAFTPKNLQDCMETLSGTDDSCHFFIFSDEASIRSCGLASIVSEDTNILQIHLDLACTYSFY